MLRALPTVTPAVAVAAALAVLPGVAEAGGLLSGVRALRVVATDGQQTEVPLEPGVRFETVTPLGDGWIAGGARDDSALLLIRSGAADPGPERVVTPPAGGRRVSAPLPVAGPAAGEARLEGLAWLSGDGPRSLAVRYAPWHGGQRGQGDGWGAVETVAGPGPGSQLALAASVDDAGEVWLAWSAFDGEDDEILWSRRSDGEWSTPERIGADNRVPDITPALTMVGGQPIAAWSRYDGRTYRLVVSRWRLGGWSEPAPVAGGGSLYPAFVATPGGERDGTLLLYRDVPVGGWTVLRLDRELRPRARASIPSAGDRPPVVLRASGDDLHLIPSGDGPMRGRNRMREQAPIRIPWTRLP